MLSSTVATREEYPQRGAASGSHVAAFGTPNPLRAVRVARTQCCVEGPVGLHRLLRRRAAEAVAELAGALGHVGRPHLQDRVGEAELEDRAGDGGEDRLAADLQPLPDLATAADGEAVDRLGLGGREDHAALHAGRGDPPGVHVPRRDAVRAQGQRQAGVAVQLGVVDRVAGDELAGRRVGALGDEVAEDREDALRLPAQAQREVRGVHAEVAHDADRAAVPRLALPVDRLAAIEVAGVQEVAGGLDRLAERAGRDGLVGELGTRVERHLARAPDEDPGLVDGGADPLGGGEVDAERLLREEVLARGGRGGVELLVQMVRDREVEDLDGVVVEQVAVVGRLVRDRVDAVDPAQGPGARVGDGGEHRADGVVLEGVPAADGGGELAAHEAAPDDADTDELRGHVPTSPWTTARSLATMPAGSGCWMTLRPYTMPRAPWSR